MQRYLPFSAFLNRYFDGKIQKITIDAGFSCPNRDGFISSGGCIYCNNRSFSPGFTAFYFFFSLFLSPFIPVFLFSLFLFSLSFYFLVCFLIFGFLLSCFLCFRSTSASLLFLCWCNVVSLCATLQ